MNDTFGHLAPEERRKYHGTIVAALGCFGYTACIECKFPGLPSSPWFYSDLQEFLPKILKKEGIVRWEGYYFKYKNGNHRFSGKAKEIILPA